MDHHVPGVDEVTLMSTPLSGVGPGLGPYGGWTAMVQLGLVKVALFPRPM
jgi:hypothetical protein